MGYSPAKKKVGRRTHGVSSSPRNAVILADDTSSDNSNEDTPIVCITQPKKRESKITLDSSFFQFLRPATFDTQMFSRGHPHVYSEEEMAKFDASFQKQLLFNFCAMHASCKKLALMLDSHASCLREIDLDLTPASFSLESSDHHELSRYVLEDLLSCLIGSHLIVCIWVGATGNPTELSYSEQAMHIFEERKRSGLISERWRMVCESFNVMQGILIRSTLHHEVVRKSLLRGLFTKYFLTRAVTLESVLMGARLSFPYRGMMLFIVLRY